MYRPLVTNTEICMFVFVCQWKCPMASAAFTLTTGSGSCSSITKPEDEHTRTPKTRSAPGNKPRNQTKIKVMQLHL